MEEEIHQKISKDHLICKWLEQGSSLRPPKFIAHVTNEYDTLPHLLPL